MNAATMGTSPLQREECRHSCSGGVRTAVRRPLRLAAAFTLHLLLAATASAQFGFQIPRLLKPSGQIDPALMPEVSGIVQSLRYDGVFWVLGDSGSGNRIAPVTADGKLARGWPGAVAIEGIKNNDWEDIALDGQGNLIIADIGNNSGRRKQLMLHFVREPRPGAKSVKPTRTIRVHYEDQKGESPDFDCEAVFCSNDRIYVLTKRRSDNRTHLYRVAGDAAGRSNPLRRVADFDIGGLVTSADVSPDGRLVAVLTYGSLWVFPANAKTGDIFRGPARRLPIFAWQAEGVAFDGNDALVVANEEGQLHRVALSDFPAAQP